MIDPSGAGGSDPGAALPQIPSDARRIFIVSDATGDTAEKVTRAALRQFSHTAELRLYTNVRDDEDMRAIVRRAAREDALVVFTVVNLEQREALHRLLYEMNVEFVNLIGSLIAKLTGYLGEEPQGVPGLLHRVSEEYFHRIEAVEFTVNNDDGREPRNLARANLVLVGVSRTSKTPLSTFLAQKGLRVANIPLVLGIEPPRELDSIAPGRVFGLTIEVDTLMEIRQARLRAMGMPATTNYALRDHVRQELNFAHAVFRKHPEWVILDVTRKAVEETAAEILSSQQRRAR